MALEIGQEIDVVVAGTFENVLAEKAVSRLSMEPAYGSRRSLAIELASRLIHEKAGRLRLGFNHWEEHAASIADRLLDDVLSEAKRKREISEFIVKMHRKALRYAGRFLARAEACEDAIAAAYLKLQTGKTSEKYFMRALKHVCLDMRKRERIETALFESAEAPCLRNGRVNPHLDGVENDLDGLLSTLPEDQDPLEILCQQEDQKELRTQVAAAMSDPRWRFLKRRKWAMALLPAADKCAELGASIAF